MPPLRMAYFYEIGRFSEPQFGSDVGVVSAYGANADAEKPGNLHGLTSSKRLLPRRPPSISPDSSRIRLSPWRSRTCPSTNVRLYGFIAALFLPQF
jgi:hypothetical protein